MKDPKPITISDELAAQYLEADQAERFDKAVRQILSVPHSEILKREAAYKKASALNPNRRGPKPKRKSA
jgi:hypothetical protein